VKHETGHVQPGFSWPSADAFLFDIDGTLVNSRDGVHYNAFHSALRSTWNIGAVIDGVPVHGNTDLGILRAVARNQGIADADFDAKLESALEHMRAEAAKNAAGMQPECCSGIRELLRGLASRGKTLGVVSGNLEQIGWLKLTAAGLRDYFALGAFSDHREKRADIFRHGIEQARALRGADARVVFVGDTPSDIVAAREVGAPVIAVATGIFSASDLSKLDPDVCVDCCDELLAQLAKAN
jgi:phosphoglycolate phosphatase